MDRGDMEPTRIGRYVELKPGEPINTRMITQLLNVSPLTVKTRVHNGDLPQPSGGMGWWRWTVPQLQEIYDMIAGMSKPYEGLASLPGSQLLTWNEVVDVTGANPRARESGRRKIAPNATNPNRWKASTIVDALRGGRFPGCKLTFAWKGSPPEFISPVNLTHRHTPASGRRVIADMAREIGVSTSAVHKAIVDGRIPAPTRESGRLVRSWPEDEFDEAVAAYRQHREGRVA